MTPSLCWEDRSQYQHSIIYDHPTLGRQLFLDCNPKSSTADEFIYHESLVHPAMLARGDGEGSIAAPHR
jgi:spermidine synthase